MGCPEKGGLSHFWLGLVSQPPVFATTLYRFPREASDIRHQYESGSDIIAAHAPLEQSAPDDSLVVIPGQLVEMACVFQFMRRIGQGREGHAVLCKADAYIQSAAGKRCTAVCRFTLLSSAVLPRLSPPLFPAFPSSSPPAASDSRHSRSVPLPGSPRWPYSTPAKSPERASEHPGR